MSMKAEILFLASKEIQRATDIAEYVESGSSRFNPVWIDGKFYVVIKPLEEKKETYEEVRHLAGGIARDLSSRKVDAASLNVDELAKGVPGLEKGEAVQAFVEGWHLGSYQFFTYKSNKTPFQTKLGLEGSKDLESFIREGEIRVQAVSFSRDLMNEVPNVLNPETFPEVLKEAFESENVEVNIYRKQQLEELEMHGVLAVNRGSKYDPAFVEMVYRGDESKPLIALVGKGVTFDTGGISLKSGRNISDMRMDMGGAAAVAGAMKLLALSGAKVNVTALIPMVENMPDNSSLLPSEVIRYKNGLTVQVGNTDAEGRLILADGIIRAGDLGAEYIIDIATLTGAVVNALGSKVAGVFGNEEIAVQLKRIGESNGDRVWPLPLVDDYDRYLDSDYADLCNISSKGEAGAITAALFLRRFVPETANWLHVDMAGVMESSGASGYYPKSATGFGARLLADFAVEISK
ncbi:leucyl aminopeptidase family protein [Siminovitchia acidinfaciens]|uniref:Probable cytosol aminopeptidase n=2 Tax=Siminovitchia acidinfaciens TaxID=2321395 RepID=A0A429Y6E2_9BACI|nr:leucyl aminopeptidase family protein [Siminovitchia acidinfaciens]